MMRAVVSSSKSVVCSMVFMLAVWLLAGVYQPAEAAIVTVPIDSQCTFFEKSSAGNAAVVSTNSMGFTWGLVYCVKKEILSGATAYINALNASTVMIAYKWLAITLALTLYGIKLMTLGIEELFKATMLLIFKIAIALYLIESTSTNLTNLSNVMDQLIGWVSKGMVNVASAHGCFLSPPADAAVWQIFDCVLGGMFGLASDPSFIMGSLLIIIAAAIFTSTLGVIIAMLGITTMVQMLFTLARAIYGVLLAYITLSFLMLLTPLIAPLLMFESHKNQSYTRDLFEKWVGLILSTVFQPMFIIGFLSLTVMILNAFIVGPLPGPGANPPGNCVLPNAQGQGGSGVCSIEQLLNLQATPSTQNVQAMQNNLEPNVPLFSWQINGDPQGHSLTGGWLNPMTYVNLIKTAGIAVINQALKFAGSLGPHITRLKATVPIGQLILTLTTFSLMIAILRQLMEVIPEMARTIAGNVGLALFSQARVPFESMIASAVKGGGDSMRNASAGKGLLKGNLKGITGAPGVARKGLGGFSSAIGKNIMDNF